MENANKGNRQHGNEGSRTGAANQWNDEKVVNEQEQNKPVNTGDEEFKENVTGRTPEQPPRDLNLNDSTNSSDSSQGGAEIETPHKHEGDDEESTEKKLPKM